MTLARAIASFVAGFDSTKFSEEVLHAGKRVFVDCLGGTIAGSVDQAARTAQAYVRSLETGTGKATVVGTAMKASPERAALANGIAAHVLDIDDTSLSMAGHPSPPVLPVSLALCEAYGMGGLRLLESYIVGFEVEAKLGLMMGHAHTDMGWHTAGTYGVIGAAAAACYLLQLSEQQTVNAVGIAVATASGVASNFGSMVKSFHAGHAASNGIKVSLLAERGFTAQSDAFEAQKGFYDALLGGASPQWSAEQFAERLGNPFDILKPGTDIKLYPSCNLTHNPIDALRELVDCNPEIQPDIVRSIVVEAGRTLPYLLTRKPRSGLDAKFSLEFCLALVIRDHNVQVDHFTDEVVRDPVIQSLMERITWHESPDKAFGARVTVTLNDGGVFEQTVDYPRGSSRSPLSDQEVWAKYHALAARVLPERAVKQSLDVLKVLEDISDLSQLTNELGKPAS